MVVHVHYFELTNAATAALTTTEHHLAMRKSLWMSLSIALVVGFGIGSGATWVLIERGRLEVAKAELLAASNARRASDLLSAMLHAQRASANVPWAYEPYEAIGDIYSQLGLKSDSQQMYRRALERIQADGAAAMLTTGEVTSTDSAEALLNRKLVDRTAK